MATGQLIFQPPKFDWYVEDQQLAFEESKGQIVLALKASNIDRERWHATIVGFLDKEGFNWWNNLPLSKQEENKKNPNEVFKAIADTLEVSTSYWKHIDEMYNDIRQGEHESTDQLDQCIKDLVKRCQYQTEAEKMVPRTELPFHAMKYFEVKKWVRLKKKREDIMYQALLQHAKEHEMMVKDFNWHKSNCGIATVTTVDEIKSFKFKKGNSHRANFRSGQGNTCSKCRMSHPPRECPVWGKKCYKCGNKNRFSTCCRSKQKGHWDSKIPPHCRSTTRCPKGRGRWSKLRSRSRSNTWNAHSIELNSFQDHPQLHGRLSSNVHERLPNDLHGRHSFKDPEESTKFLKKTFHII